MDITIHWLVGLSVESTTERTVTKRSLLQGNNFTPRISLVTIRTSPCAAGEDEPVTLSNEETENHVPLLVQGARRGLPLKFSACTGLDDCTVAVLAAV